MRHYVRASELKASGIDWVKVLLSDLVSEKFMLIARLRADSAFASEAERVEAFTKYGGGGKTTYYKHLAKNEKARHKAGVDSAQESTHSR